MREWRVQARELRRLSKGRRRDGCGLRRLGMPRVWSRHPISFVPVPTVYAFGGVGINPPDTSALYMPTIGIYGLAKGHGNWLNLLWAWATN